MWINDFDRFEEKDKYEISRTRRHNGSLLLFIWIVAAHSRSLSVDRSIDQMESDEEERRRRRKH